ncbi:hypothetical protein [Georgenia ruanii]|uniref:hypothetical protein n=1 Tax=Georgenia ruanii TaxID=348442 RepID=UPI0012648192|nr:hypothetical protein [Georgenia ruanii]
MYPLDDLYPVVVSGAESAAAVALVATLVLRRRTSQAVQRSRLRSASRCFGWSAILLAPLVLALLGFPGARAVTGAVPELAWFAVPMYTLVTALLFAAGLGWCAAAAQADSGSHEGAVWR